MKKKTIRLARETLTRLDHAKGGAPGASWSACPTISCISCSEDPCCAP